MLTRICVAACLLAVVGLTGCDHINVDEEEGLVCDTPFNASDFPTPTVSFETDIVPILAANGCSSGFCHGNPNDPPSDFSVLSKTSILGPGAEAEQLDVCNVERGDPDNSYIVMKLMGSPGIIGDRMPLGSTDPIPPADLATIRQWITEGAYN